MLYGLHYGSIPNIAGSPPNYGLDPYVAERTANGWVTRYVGIPGEGLADDEAYGSPLLGADEQLNSFAFGGKGICDPCFEGNGTNIPVRLNGSAPALGMVGAYSGPSEPEGTVVKSMSADGSHLVFGSEHAFATGGEEGELNIYSRNLSLGTTELVSTDESGNALSDPGLAELDLSSDGSRVLVGEEASEEGENVYYQLYLAHGRHPASVKLSPGPVLFDGMTADGSRVFFTTKDNLAGDTDESADIFEVEIASNGTASAPRLISTSRWQPVEQRLLRASRIPRTPGIRTPAKGSAMPSPSPAAPAWPRVPGPSTSSVPSSSTVAKARPTSPTYTWSRPAAILTSSPRSTRAKGSPPNCPRTDLW